MKDNMYKLLNERRKFRTCEINRDAMRHLTKERDIKRESEFLSDSVDLELIPQIKAADYVKLCRV